jgi:hypothetical protein
MQTDIILHHTITLERTSVTPVFDLNFLKQQTGRTPKTSLKNYANRKVKSSKPTCPTPPLFLSPFSSF